MNPAEIDRDVVLWSTPHAQRANRPLLVLLHGFGADEGDLFGVASHFPSPLVVASLRGPLPIGSGFAWFPPRDGGDGPDSDSTPVGSVLRWVDDLEPQPTTIGLLGFSQGGAMALELMRQRPRQFSYVVLLSGFCRGGERVGDGELGVLRPPVFWGRGGRDPLISSAMVEQTAAWLDDHATVEVHLYPELEHTLSVEELGDISRFIEVQLAGER